MQKKRLAAGIVAAALLVGSVGFAVVNSSTSLGNVVEDSEEPVVSNNDYSFAYGVVQSLYYKINELWRLSINSDLDMETVSAISVLNGGFDSELLEKAVEAEGDEVIDEYIYAVLAGLDFELYLEDREAYDKAKNETVYTGEVLTREKIDEYLNKLNEETAEMQVNEAVTSVPGVDVPTPGAANDISTAVPQVPTAESVMPENPAESIRRETEAITNRALGIEVE